MGSVKHNCQIRLVREKSVKDDEMPRKRVKRIEEEKKHMTMDDVADLFVRLILEGQWDESLSMLHEIGGMNDNIMKSASLVILEQTYVELLEEGKVLDAFDILQTVIVPLANNDHKILEKLAIFLAYSGKKSLVRASSRNSKLECRKESLDELRKLLYPTIVVPERRLVDAYHGLRDQDCRYYENKILFLQFSHSGKYLASSSGDGLVIVWEVYIWHRVSGEPISKLVGHSGAVNCVSWNPTNPHMEAMILKYASGDWVGERIEPLCFCFSFKS